MRLKGLIDLTREKAMIATQQRPFPKKADSEILV